MDPDRVRDRPLGYHATSNRGDLDAALLTETLDFTGPLAGHRADATEGFLRGVAGFIETVDGIEVIHDVHDDGGSAVLHTATMSGGTVTFAEFFTIDDGRISTLRLHYNGPEYLDKGGR